MTTLFIWDDYQVHTKWDSFTLKYINGLDKRKMGVEGTAARMISNTNWEAFCKRYTINEADWEGSAALMISDDEGSPFADIEGIAAILEYYKELGRAWQMAGHGSRDYAIAQKKMKRLDKVLASCLVDQSDNYVSTLSETNQYYSKNIWSDILRKGRIPDHIIYIRETRAQREQMRDWWLRQKAEWPEGTRFKPQEPNCFQMVAHAIIEGFQCHQLMFRILFWKLKKFRSPSDIRSLALKIGRCAEEYKVLSWSAFVDEMVKKKVIPKDISLLLEEAKVFRRTHFLEPVLGIGPAGGVGQVLHGRLQEDLVDFECTYDSKPTSYYPPPDWTEMWPDDEAV